MKLTLRWGESAIGTTICLFDELLNGPPTLCQLPAVRYTNRGDWVPWWGCRGETQSQTTKSQMIAQNLKGLRGFCRLPGTQLGMSLESLSHASALDPVSPSGCAERHGSTRKRWMWCCFAAGDSKKTSKEELGGRYPQPEKNNGGPTGDSRPICILLTWQPEPEQLCRLW